MSLTFQTYTDAIAYPITDEKSGVFVHNTVIPGTLREWHTVCVFNYYKPIEQTAAVDSIKETVIYGGCLINHYGHFLMFLLFRELRQDYE